MSQWRINRFRNQFYIVWQEGSIRRRYSLGTDDAKEAQRRASARYAELTRPRGKTVEELWKGYMIDMEGRAVVETMRHSWKALHRRFGSMDGEAITIADCRAHVKERRNAGRRDGTIHTELGHLRMVLLWAEKHGFISKAPVIERPSKPAPKDAFLTRDEVVRLIEAAKAHHIQVAIELLIGTGARISAALELTWDRVDLERRTIQLRNPDDGARRKGRATVPMNDGLFLTLSTARGAALCDHVIEWAGAPVKSIKKGLKAAGAAIGRPDVSAHMLRHSAAVWLAEDGHSMDEIAQFLGHNDSRITARVYARYSPTHLRKLARSLDIRSAP
ncbi:MAG: integrase [Phyllobacteriaceae bacterium]|nr:integrase [Phyllobacteriaceae bacterium]MBA91103.1 integrase [Phyllobacteriaceae bacterium]